MLIESRKSGHAIHGSYDAVERVDVAEVAIGHQRMQDRRRVREPGRLDHDALELRDGSRGAARCQVCERQHEIAAHIAAQAAIGELHEALVAGFDQLVVEPDRAEFIDDHRRAAHRGVAQEACEQRGLAAA